MKKVFFPIESVTISHVVRPLQVARQLRERDVEVVFGVDARYRDLVESDGFAVKPLYVADPEMLLRAVRSLDFKARDKALPEYLRADIEALKSTPDIDLVVADTRFMIRFAAEHVGIPYASIVNGYHTPYYSLLPDVPEAIGARLPNALRRSQTFRKILNRVVPRLEIRPHLKVAREAGLVPSATRVFDLLVSDTLTLICDLPEVTPQTDMPSHYHFVGPILWEPEDTGPLPAGLDEDSRPLIYATLGTSGIADSRDLLFKAFADAPVKVLFSGGHLDFDNAPANFYCVPFVKASSVLRRASLMISQGGNGSVYQALNEGVPVLSLATFYDQEWFAERMRELGVGDWMFHKYATPQSLRAMADRILADSTAAPRLAAQRASMAQSHGAERAAELIVDLLNNGPQRDQSNATRPTKSTAAGDTL